VELSLISRGWNVDNTSWLDAAGAAMWALIERHAGRVGYKRGIKADGLNATPPVIDCSGWAALLLTTGMHAANQAAPNAVFDDEDMAAVQTWSDQIIENLERRSGFILPGHRITVNDLPPYATIGLQQGGGAWASNHPRRRGITHVVQVVPRPSDGSPYVSEAQAMNEPLGLRLMPLADWLERTRDYLQVDKAWAVNAFSPGA
jgi:hypothetical protein